MILSHGANYFKNTLLYQTYKKAQLKVNTLSENPCKPLPTAFLEMNEEMSFCEYVPNVLGRLCSSTCLDYIDDEFCKCLENIQNNMNGHFTIEVCGLFHFGLLLDHLNLFSEAEQEDWKLRMFGLFDGFGTVCMSFHEYYEDYFKYQFFGGDGTRYSQFEKHMKFSYVFVCDFEFHTVDGYGPAFMNEFPKFTERYYKFYKDLIEEIQKRKQV